MPRPELHEIRCIGIANRGEAAWRCVRTIKAMRARDGLELRCLVLYTDADRDAPFVRHADTALRLEVPGASAASAYLDAELLLSALRRGGADAVWPGWGFLSEDADFADRVEQSGMLWLGPPGDVIRALGDKIGAKQVAERCGVPLIPWSHGAVDTAEVALEHATRIGFPVVLKASAGGGGRGIRVVPTPEKLKSAFESARTEARGAFGDDRIFVEERLRGGRHIEVQIAADAHGAVWALGCRDCSVQRRHQKILEEAPPPGLDPEIRARLEESAVALARHTGYRGVGTVEFLVQGDRAAFLEVNPRLQVEHGLTEELTGIDLVEMQIRIGRGEPLVGAPPPSQGAAIEARVCAEDPEADFLPSPGRIARFDPSLGRKIRVDTGVSAGCQVPRDFDSLIAKVIATGSTREEARASLAAALTDFELVVEGGATNKGYLLQLIDSARFRRADYDTEWLDQDEDLRGGSAEYSVAALCAAAVLSYQRVRDAARRALLDDPNQLSPGSVPASTGQRVDLSYRGESYELAVFAIGAWRYRVHLDGRVVPVALRGDGPHRATLELGGRNLRLLYDLGESGLRVEVEGQPYRFGTGAAGEVRAGTPAMVVGLDVATGDLVEAGAALGRLEAMKMEIGFEAPISGRVKQIFVGPGQQVSVGELLLAIEPDGAEQVAAGPRLALHEERDPLDSFFDSKTGEPDLHKVEQAPEPERRAAIAAAREEVRRVLIGYDLNLQRGEKLAACLEAPLPRDLSERFRWELAEIRHELTLFADIEALFSHAPLPRPGGEAGPSSRALLLEWARRYRDGGEALAEGMRRDVLRALSHYGVSSLEPGDALERALLRMLASQHTSELRRRLVLGCLARVHACASSGLRLGDDRELDALLERIAGLRGLVSDAVADLSLESRYAIFESPRLEAQAERTSKEVDAWLAAAESSVTPPPESVLAHLAAAPRAVFYRVGGWLEDESPRRRAIAVAAHVRRLYAHQQPQSQTSAMVGSVHVERLDLSGDRIVLASVARPSEVAATLDKLGRAANAASVRTESRRVHAIEVLVPLRDPGELESSAEFLGNALSGLLPCDRLTLTLLAPETPPRHLTFEALLEPGASRMQERLDLHRIHPEAAARIDLDRLRDFDLERLESPEDLYCFHLRSPEIPDDERMIVLADVRGRSPDVENGHEASLHVAAFERDFFEAARSLRNHLQLRDPRRRLQWNRLVLFATPTVYLDQELVDSLARRLHPATRHLGLEKVVVRLRVLDREQPEAPAQPVEIVFADPTGSRLELSWRTPHHDPLRPAQIYERKVVEARRRRLIYPYEIIRMLIGAPGGVEIGDDTVPPGHFEEYDLDPDSESPRARSVAGRAPALNSCAIVFGVIETPTEQVPEGLRRVLILSDPTVGMGSLGDAECRRIIAGIDLAEALSLPVEWVPVSSGARIAMDSGTENLDATARVVRRIVTFTQAGGSIHVIVQGVNVGAQSYFDALATMLMHTRGVLIMTPAASMVLTGRAALAASGSVTAEDEVAIGGYERVMGPNGQAQFLARSLAEAYSILYQHYRYAYVVPGEKRPRDLTTRDPRERRAIDFETRRAHGHDFERIGEIFDPATNAERKRPFAMRALMDAVVDADLGHLERWRGWRGAETAIVWDACLGGRPVTLIGIESRNLDRGGDNPADGPSAWTGGTLFPLSSKKVARALSAATGVRPVVVLANLSGFDGSPESMRKLQLEYGAEIARAVVNFEGPIAFLVVSRYHGGAYVVFSRALNPGLRAAAVEGSFASVIGGGPAAAVVFTREARARALRDPEVEALRLQAEQRGDAESRGAFEEAFQRALLRKQAELGAEFDRIHTVERALAVGSLETLVPADQIRSFLIDRVLE